MIIRKVSSFQITIAAMILGGFHTISYRDVGCIPGSWKDLRRKARLARVDAGTSMVTPAAQEWARAVQEHQEQIKDRRQTDPEYVAARKIRRLQSKLARAGR